MVPKATNKVVIGILLALARMLRLKQSVCRIPYQAFTFSLHDKLHYLNFQGQSAAAGVAGNTALVVQVWENSCTRYLLTQNVKSFSGGMLTNKWGQMDSAVPLMSRDVGANGGERVNLMTHSFIPVLGKHGTCSASCYFFL